MFCSAAQKHTAVFSLPVIRPFCLWPHYDKSPSCLRRRQLARRAQTTTAGKNTQRTRPHVLHKFFFFNCNLMHFFFFYLFSLSKSQHIQTVILSLVVLILSLNLNTFIFQFCNMSLYQWWEVTKYTSTSTTSTSSLVSAVQIILPQLFIFAKLSTKVLFH